MREQIILISLLILWASAADGDVGGRETSLDVLGGQANNTTIIAPDGSAIGVDIVGSTTNNLQITYPTEPEEFEVGDDNRQCGPCGEEKTYETPWDDFKRPLCYPWSSYIPTRYNRQFIREDNGYLSTVPGTVTLGKGKTYS